MTEDDGIDAAPQTWQCPECGQPVEHSDDPNDHLMICPFCGNQFFVQEDPEPEAEPREALESSAGDSDELDAAHIRKHAAMRRALYRSRSYAIMGLGVCGVGVVHLVMQLFRGAYPDHRIALVWVIILGLLIGTSFFFRKAAAYQREIRQLKPLADPVGPPDFSTLSDGSQRVRHLEDLR